ncbi:MAG: HlyC/CorC family transporter, partial [Treponema sp.]|nr:HlyC/CorC family transporter [Treponema sp.]
KMSQIQSLLHQNRQNFAVVIDEYSGTDGILTGEDIAREIFGGIADDDQRGYATDVSTDNEDFSDTVLEGSVRLVDLEETLHIKMESSMNETLAGFIIEKLNRFPVLGESIEYSGFKFTVEEMEDFRISKVRCEQVLA